MKWEVREVAKKIGVKTLYQVCRETGDGTIETAGGHYESVRIAQALANVLNREEDKHV